MDSNILVDLMIGPDLILYAVDKTDYFGLGDPLSNHVFVEFITDRDGNMLEYKFNRISMSQFRMNLQITTSFSLSSDGEIIYYKLVIPTLEHFEGNSTENKIFFYKGRIFYSSFDNEITDLLKLYEERESQGFFWASKKVFSIGKLEKCLLNLQRKAIENCSNKKCSEAEDLKLKRDFIFSSVYVLKYLIASRNFKEAQRILDNLSMCGANICDDENSLLNKGCGCGNYN